MTTSSSRSVKTNRDYLIGDILILGDGTQDTRAERAVIALVTSVVSRSIEDETIQDEIDRYVVLGLQKFGHIDGDELYLFENTQRKVMSQQWTSRVKASELAR